MSALTTLKAYHAQYGHMLTSSKISEPLVRGLYWKLRRWEMDAILVDLRYSDNDNAILNAEYERDEAAREHRKVIQAAWDARKSGRRLICADDAGAWLDHVAAALGVGVAA